MCSILLCVMNIQYFLHPLTQFLIKIYKYKLKHDMFWPLLGHHQVYCLCLLKKQVQPLSTNYTPDDDTIRSET
jgi:hypothetical protein